MIGVLKRTLQGNGVWTMQIQVKQHRRVAIVAAFGSLDAHSAREFGASVDPYINEQSPSVLVEMSNVTFLDSTGLAVMVQLLRKCKASGGDLCLCNLHETVSTILEITQLNTVLRTAVDLQTGLAALR